MGFPSTPGWDQTPRAVAKGISLQRNGEYQEQHWESLQSISETLSLSNVFDRLVTPRRGLSTWDKVGSLVLPRTEEILLALNLFRRMFNIQLALTGKNKE